MNLSFDLPALQKSSLTPALSHGERGNNKPLLKVQEEVSK
jgi:hypothetical protein